MTQSHPAPGNWRRDESTVEKEPRFKVDLRIEGIAHDVILKDEERKGKNQEAVGNLRKGSHTKSIREDLRQQDKLYDIQWGIQSHHPWTGQHRAVRTGTHVQHRPVPFMLQAFAGGDSLLFMWMCLRPGEATMERIRTRFQTLIVPYYLARINRSRGKKHGETQWQQDHWKAMDARGGAKKHKKEEATGWEVQKFSASPWMDRRILPIPGLPQEAPGMQRWGSSSWTNEGKKRFQTHYENSRKSSTRTRTTEFLHSKERENEAKTIRWSIASKIRMEESKLEELFLAIFFLLIISQNWWQHEHQDSQWRQHQDTHWRDHQWQDYQWRDHQWWIRRFSREFRLQAIAIFLYARV